MIKLPPVRVDMNVIRSVTVLLAIRTIEVISVLMDVVVS